MNTVATSIVSQSQEVANYCLYELLHANDTYCCRVLCIVSEALVLSQSRQVTVNALLSTHTSVPNGIQGSFVLPGDAKRTQNHSCHKSRQNDH